MPLTTLQKQALADELVEVMERFQHDVDTHTDQYEAVITQPSSEHLVIKLQPVQDIDEQAAELVSHP